MNTSARRFIPMALLGVLVVGVIFVGYIAFNHISDPLAAYVEKRDNVEKHSFLAAVASAFSNKITIVAQTDPSTEGTAITLSLYNIPEGYLVNFGDNSPTQKVPDTCASGVCTMDYTYDEAGTYTVELINTKDKVVAETSVTVSVD